MELFWSEEDQQFYKIPDGDIATPKEIKEYYERKIMDRPRVFVIGSVSHMERINRVVSKYEEMGYFVESVRKQPDKPLMALIENAFRHISYADLVVAVRKPDGSLGNGTLYELAFAQFIRKETRIEEGGY